MIWVQGPRHSTGPFSSRQLVQDGFGIDAQRGPEHQEVEDPQDISRSESWEKHGKIMGKYGKSSQNHCKNTGKYGKSQRNIGKTWENHGKIGKSWELYVCVCESIRAV